MSEMVERVARAMAATRPEAYRFDWTKYIDDARAAIAAMREPTDEMLTEGWQYSAIDASKGSVAHIWQKMIDEALK